MTNYHVRCVKYVIDNHDISTQNMTQYANYNGTRVALCMIVFGGAKMKCKKRTQCAKCSKRRICYILFLGTLKYAAYVCRKCYRN